MKSSLFTIWLYILGLPSIAQMDTKLIHFMYLEDIIDDNEYVIMSLPSYQERLLLPAYLDLATMTESQSRNNFPFSLADLPRLAVA